MYYLASENSYINSNKDLQEEIEAHMALGGDMVHHDFTL